MCVSVGTHTPDVMVVRESFWWITEETDSNADRYRESDRSSNLSDVKADIRAGSSVSNAESVTALDSEGEGSTRGVNALALAGPVVPPISAAGFRYSADYTEPSFPPKSNVSISSLLLLLLLLYFFISVIDRNLTYTGARERERERMFIEDSARVKLSMDRAWKCYIGPVLNLWI